MDCFICGSKMADYLEKKMRPELPAWNYVRCERCGLVLCQTVYEMSDGEWKRINDGCREKFGHDEDPDDPNWLARLHCQAKLFAELAACDVWKPEMRFVDYGCGDGKLADYVQNELSVHRGGGGGAKKAPEIRKIQAAGWAPPLFAGRGYETPQL